MPHALRLFAALYPPSDVLGPMLALLAPLALPKHRPVPAGQVHLTLHFVGDTDPRQLDDVLESVRRSAAGIAHITLAPKRLVTLPEKGPPRLVALETDAPPNLLELQRRLVHRLARRPRRDAADRFLPHLTLARFATPGGDRLDAPAPLPPFRVESVALVESVLRPEGAEHRVRESISLSSPRETTPTRE